MVGSQRLHNVYTKFHFPSSKCDGLQRACWQQFITFHQAKVRDEQNICVVERKGELSDYEHMKKCGCGSRILSFTKEPLPKLSVCSSQSGKKG